MRRSARRTSTLEMTSRDGRTTSLATTTCAHCNHVTVIPYRAKPEQCGGFCRLCMKTTCLLCADKGCTPFERRLDQQEARARSLRSMGL